MRRPGTAAVLARRASAGAKHRGPGRAVERSYADDFAPRHCAGETCFHDHPNLTRAQQHDAAGQPGKASYLRARTDLRRQHATTSH